MEPQLARHRKDALRYFPENASAIVICLSTARDVIKAEVVASEQLSSSYYYSRASSGSISLFVLIFLIIFFILLIFLVTKMRIRRGFFDHLLFLLRNFYHFVDTKVVVFNLKL